MVVTVASGGGLVPSEPLDAPGEAPRDGLPLATSEGPTQLGAAERQPQHVHSPLCRSKHQASTCHG